MKAIVQGGAIVRILGDAADAGNEGIEGDYVTLPVPAEIADQHAAGWPLSIEGGEIVLSSTPAWTALRARRDTLMFATDPTQLADKTDEYRSAWQAYRQALKDLPETVEDPFNPEWPVPPDEAELAKLGSAFLAARATNLSL